MNASRFSSLLEHSHYRDFRASLSWLSHEVPYLALLGCDSATLSQMIKTDIQQQLPGAVYAEQWQCSDDFAKAFNTAPGSTILLDFCNTGRQLTDREIAEQLLFYRDKVVCHHLNLICIATEAQMDLIHSEAFDFVAAASFSHSFKTGKLPYSRQVKNPAQAQAPTNI